jgi:hypothetical protein
VSSGVDALGDALKHQALEAVKTFDRFSASGQRLLRRLAFVSTSDIVGTSPLSSIHHDRIRIDEMREPN